MTAALFQCDGASIPPAFKSVEWDVTQSLNSRGPAATLNLRLENLSHALLATIGAHAADLVRIAAYAYAADQSVSRGGPADIYGRKWRRRFALAVPVSDPAFWNDADVCSRLEQLLEFASDDQWELQFCKAAPDVEQLLLGLGEKALLNDPDSVVLFSGGADSLCATVDAVVAQNKRPVLVSHRPAPNVDAQQKQLVAELRLRLPVWDFPQISVWVHRKGSDASDTSQRTRAFLFASIGAAVASQLGITDLLLSDNGVTSVNLPINAQLVGALASRSTHPKLLRLFNDLAARMSEPPVVARNSLSDRTRPEALSVLTEAGLPELLQETISCAHRRGRPLVQPHCGVCSQCIDRRFASIAAGLEEHDLVERYEVDVFRSPIPEGNALTLAESYIRSALDIARKDDDAMFLDYPQLHECIDPNDPNPAEMAEALIGLFRRHATTVVRVMETQLAINSGDLVQGALPATSLVRLVASGQHLVDTRVRTVDSLTRAIWRGLPPIFRDRAPKNEREVQNAVEGLLQAMEADLRREVPLLPFAGIGTKPDFARAEALRGWLFIEMKYPSGRSRLNGIVTEMTSRASIYRQQEAHVLFVVYDPGRYIVDDEHFKADCSLADGVWVEVVR